mgnify:CR=1 FL=1
MVNLQNLTITIFGGTGFVGRHLVKELCNEDCRLQIPTRDPAKSYFLQPLGDVGQIIPIKCDFSKKDDVRKVIDNADIIINLIGILYEKKKTNFENVHLNIVKKIVDICNSYGNKKIIHFSAIGSKENTNSLYAQTKYQAEQYISENFKSFSVIKPSIIFGPEDNFFNFFAKMALFSPILPLIMGGKTKFQPVYVVDVCKGVIKILKQDTIKQQIYEFGGPEIYTFQELMKILLKIINRKRFLLYIPKTVAVFLATILEFFSIPLLTKDQIKLLEKDNIVSNKDLNLKDLNVNPVSLELIGSDYLKRFVKK